MLQFTRNLCGSYVNELRNFGFAGIEDYEPWGMICKARCDIEFMVKDY